MSHDLFLLERDIKLDKKSFTSHFKSRPHYKLQKGQAVYQNDDTGVYFIFDEPEEGMVAFNLNYFRPHTFGLEAAIELEAFAAAFSPIITDEEGTETTFNKDSFLRDWNHGNRFGHRAMIREAGPIHTWPAKRIRQVWQWNYSMPHEDGPDIFVPRIFAVEGKPDPLSVAIWPPK